MPVFRTINRGITGVKAQDAGIGEIPIHDHIALFDIRLLDSEAVDIGYFHQLISDDNNLDIDVAPVRLVTPITRLANVNLFHRKYTAGQVDTFDLTSRQAVQPFVRLRARLHQIMQISERGIKARPSLGLGAHNIESSKYGHAAHMQSRASRRGKTRKARLPATRLILGMPPMKQIFRITLCALLLAVSNLTAKTFEGTVHMKISAGKEGTHQLSYSIKGTKLRTEIQAGNNVSATAIMDTTKDEIIMLMPGQPMYMTMSLKGTVAKATGNDMNDTTLENTGITETILGYTCTKYIARNKEGDMEIWATTELGTFMGLGNNMGGMMGAAKNKASWEQTLTGKDFFPLRVKNAPGNRNQFTLEATSIEKKSLPDSLFLPPEGYQKFDMGGMMQGLMGGGQLNR